MLPKLFNINVLIIGYCVYSVVLTDQLCPEIDCAGLNCGDCDYEIGPDGCPTCNCQVAVGDMCLTDFQYRWMNSNGYLLRSLSSVVAKWTNDITDDGFYRIPFGFSSAIANNADATSVIIRALGIFNAMTCLRFEPQTADDVTSVIIFSKGSGCGSSVGRKRSPQRVSLGSGCYTVGIALHEVMHALGVWHEQSRPDRDDYVKINFENIRPGKEPNFKKLPYSEVDSFGVPYDIKSIMQYSSYAFSINDNPTIVLRKNNQPFKTQGTMLSKEDLIQLNLLYGCGGKRGIPETTDCYNPLDKGSSYRGTLSTTVGGLTCQRWDSQTPNSHSYNPADVTGAGLVKNYCRNPDSDPVGPWCYATTSKRWEKCDVPLCDPAVPEVAEPERIPETTDCYFPQNAGLTYRGNLNTTLSGYTCQQWSLQTPHSHSFSPDQVTDGGLVENYCRNPDSDPVGPWCYTTSSKRWEKCDVPFCGSTTETTTEISTTATTENPSRINCYNPADLGSSYRGNQDTTEEGLTCQRWDSQTPHAHRFTPSDYPDAGLIENYCRNPDSDSIGLWCYTTSSDHRYQRCDVPLCATEETTTTIQTTTETPDLVDCFDPQNLGSSYRGNHDTTEEGLTCQRWDSQTPHAHRFTPSDFPDAGLIENYCRNPDFDSIGLWCYTTSSDHRYQRCDVPLCATEETTTTTIQTTTETPDLVDCFDPQNLGSSYRGNHDTTEEGLTCQRWDSQTPHAHRFTPSDYPDAGLIENYCRNPDSDSIGLWCYTTSSDHRYQRCDVPLCVTQAIQLLPDISDPEPTNCYFASNLGISYRGSVNTTIGGFTCQNWNSQAPHIHTLTPENYPTSGLVENYCRNPDSDPVGPWCYTTSSDLRWQKCDVPFCVPPEHPGEWSEFGDWSSCSVTCGRGIKTRSRNCINTPEKIGECVGISIETKSCQHRECRQGVWNKWNVFSSCDAYCGSGFKYSVRNCRTGNCVGKVVKRRHCHLAKCTQDENNENGNNVSGGRVPIEKVLHHVTPWSQCTVSCGGGIKYRTRKCKKKWRNTKECAEIVLQNKVCSTEPC